MNFNNAGNLIIANNQVHGFAIVAYGKLGGNELGYGSDLDLVFLHQSDKGLTDGEKPTVLRFNHRPKSEPGTGGRGMGLYIVGKAAVKYASLKNTVDKTAPGCVVGKPDCTVPAGLIELTDAARKVLRPNDIIGPSRASRQNQGKK